MHLGERFWASVTYVVNFITLTPFDNGGANNQAPLLPVSDVLAVQVTAVPTPLIPISDASVVQAAVLSTPAAQEWTPGPIFEPPSGNPPKGGEGHDFKCDYSNMRDYTNCSTPDNRGCWLRNEKTLHEYNISTNYEDIKETPTGILREYHLDVTDGIINADGILFKDAKLFNSVYPGPWIEACWGDVR